MTPERWQRLERIFNVALERAPGERAAYLEDACQGDAALLREAESLLSAHEQAGGCLDAPASAEARTLAPDQQLGAYRVLGLLGAGGMGVVYRALDTRLGREVALKVLPDSAGADQERLARLEREARAVAALNHPNIVTLHSLEENGGVRFLTMELVLGETLAERLKRGPLPLEQCLRHGVEIALALAKAHRHGIVHRDLKPGNVMLTQSGAKLLDFGLAKRAPAACLPAASGAPPTEDERLTAEGRILGTFDYMAPEQLEGKDADPRTDIFALGAVLHEMATGQRAFAGSTQASLIAAVLKSDPPPIASLLPLAPAGLEHVVARCLAKDPDQRWQSAQDVANELAWIARGDSHARQPSRRARRRERLWQAVALLGAALAGSALTLGLLKREPRSRLLQSRFQIQAPPRTAFSGLGLAVSPDGLSVAFRTSGGEGTQLHLRPLNSLDAKPLPGTEGGSLPFWSPDGQKLGFVAQGKLKQVELAGGPAEALCDARGFNGASWSQSGDIVFSQNGELFRVAAKGGQALALGTREDGEAGRYWPHFLPDGRRYLYFSRAARAGGHAIYVGSLDTSERRRLVASDNNAAYSPSGHLVFVRGDVLMAQAFDGASLQPSGEAFPVAERVASLPAPLIGAAFSLSRSGVLAWRTGSGAGDMQLTWFDRSGNRLGTLGEPGDYSNPALSPDEKRVVVGRRDPQTKTRDLWLFDHVRGTPTRLTFDAADDFNPVWSPDGARIAFTSDRRGVREIYEKRADRAGTRSCCRNPATGRRTSRTGLPMAGCCCTTTGAEASRRTSTC